MLTESKKIKIQSSLRVKLLIVFTTVILAVFMFPHGESIDSEVAVGTVWMRDDLIASMTFEILKDPEVYEAEKLNAARSIQPIFLRDNSIVSISLDSLNRYNGYLSKLLMNYTILPSNKTILSDKSFAIFFKLARQPRALNLARPVSLTRVLALSKTVLQNIYQRGLLNLSYGDIPRDSISIRDGRYENIFAKSLYLERGGINEFIRLSFESQIGISEELLESVEEYLSNFIKPNLVYSKQLTELAIRNAKDKVPRNIGIVNENERIVAKHDRIKPETKQKIDSYRIAKGEEIGFAGRSLQSLGKFLHILVIVLPLIIYIRLFRRNIYKDNLKILLISCIILFISLLSFLVYQINVSSSIEFLVLVPVASMLLTIIFDSRIGFYSTIVTSLIAGGLQGNDYAFALMNIIAGSLAAYTVRDIKNRTQIFRSFLFIFIGYAISILAFGFERFDSIGQMLSSFAFAATNALISPVITYGLIIFVERIFKITTDLTLLELTDFNKPVLKELAKNAPGTFNHSITMGTLVENTAEAIGANPMLTRVGAYYHDIGKIVDPESFVENQMNSENVHEKLTPEQSVKLIMAHVKKGIELAREHRLPKEVIDFIPMHHGTMVISYFYSKAKELYGEDKVDINEYRYPGPKPNSKETAIVMLADACESTVRSLIDADSQKIENVVTNLINSRIDDGQLDDSPLTFSDIKKIKESFLGILVGQHHKRIRYPEQDELENSKTDE
ncbi:MAG: HDIG domain-containing metalloprotein [Melioribacteraceae bacterium]